MFCRKCGTKNADGAKFCINCGAELASPQPAPQPGAPVPPHPPLENLVAFCFLQGPRDPEYPPPSFARRRQC
uniref:zinc-ribbon domain-containing protein n=1 Tax=Parolsenella massiliensis TaxID=1871022 RepID=UPI0009342099